MGHCAKGFVEGQVDTCTASPLIHWAGHVVIKGDQVCWAGCAFPKPLLAGTDALVILYVLSDPTQDNLLHNPSGKQGQVDTPVVAQIVLAALLVDGCHNGQTPAMWDLPRHPALVRSDGKQHSSCMK